MRDRSIGSAQLPGSYTFVAANDNVKFPSNGASRLVFWVESHVGITDLDLRINYTTLDWTSPIETEWKGVAHRRSDATARGTFSVATGGAPPAAFWECPIEGAGTIRIRVNTLTGTSAQVMWFLDDGWIA